MRATVTPARHDPELGEIESGSEELVGRIGEFSVAITHSEGAQP